MKELSIEEKAKRYDDAIKLVNSKWYYRNQPCFINVSELFPEFKENKDENIRKWLIEYFKEYKSTGIEGFANGLKIDSIIIWLEKQINDKDIHLLELKAKAYDDAKERMSYAYNQNRVPIGFISEIFPNLNSYENHCITEDEVAEPLPELKESEDEIIREALVALVKCNERSGHTRLNNVSTSSMFVWLEKQSKQDSNILWHNVNEEPKVKREIFCEWKSSTGIWHSIVFYHPYSKTFYDREQIIKNVLRWTYVDEMLEKQDKQ